SEVVVLTMEAQHLESVLAYTQSSLFPQALKKLDKRVAITTSTFTQVPFEVLESEVQRGQRSTPHSDDPTQWLFNGHPRSALPAAAGLQVAVARLLGYRWPRQTGSEFPDCPALGPDGLEAFADEDGIVCLAALR